MQINFIYILYYILYIIFAYQLIICKELRDRRSMPPARPDVSASFDCTAVARESSTGARRLIEWTLDDLDSGTVLVWPSCVTSNSTIFQDVLTMSHWMVRVGLAHPVKWQPGSAVVTTSRRSALRRLIKRSEF